MGCANSKSKRCHHCQAPYSSPVPLSRSYSMQIHHTARNKRDSHHVVALTSSTLGCLNLDFSRIDVNEFNEKFVAKGGDFRLHGENGDVKTVGDEFLGGLVEEAKTWSDMIEEKIPKVLPKTPVRTPPGEPETINTWELMEGLEDVSTFRSPNYFKSSSFNGPIHQLVPRGHPATLRFEETCSEGADCCSKSSASEVVSDEEAISNFKKYLEKLSPTRPFHVPPSNDQNGSSIAFNGKPLDVTEADRVSCALADDDNSFPHRKEMAIVYFTSLRGVRKTYEDCCNVRIILKAVGVRMDERDVSLHSGFKEELKELLGGWFSGAGLPRVFVGSKCIGGAEEIRRLHEEGRLERVLENCEKVDDRCLIRGGGDGICEVCGDIRFVPCKTCFGSCKVHCDRNEGDYSTKEEGEGDYFGFRQCQDCNENGLIRCPLCCY
ncbi:hypothetical protein NL676_014892 [Syzygium grande]|nr:hypothetical protein NL676_014892 [Syzygium grande]